MSRNVLISFVGTGPINKNTAGNRIYQKAKYKFNEGIIETSFVSSALGEFLNIDTYFLFGTMKSMWEEVYNKFSSLREADIDEEYWIDLSQKCGENANHSTELDKSIFTKIEQLLGNESKVCPIYYGLNEKEIKENFSIFGEAMDSLRDGDNVFLDITHSFRSLPLLATTALSFIKDITDRKIEFKGIYYGMLEVGREFEDNIVPIVDLSYLSELQTWIKGAYAFNQFGNGTLLADLLSKKDKTTAEKLMQFTNVLSMNFIHEVKSQINVLTSLSSKSYTLPANIILPKAFKSFASRFSNLQKEHEYQFELSIWHKENSNYALSYLCLIEAIVTYVCEQERLNTKGEDSRNTAKDFIFKENKYYEIKEIFANANKYRKSSAHLLDVKSTAKNGVNELDNFQKKFKKISKNAHKLI